jgi:anti-sigma B factor antagonist
LTGGAFVHAANHVRDDGSTLLVLSGEIDMSCAGTLRDKGLALLEAGGCHTLIVDLMDVSFIDSTGIGALITLRNASGRAGAPLLLLDPSPAVAKVLAITGLDDVFMICHTAECAESD